MRSLTLLTQGQIENLSPEDQDLVAYGVMDSDFKLMDDENFLQWLFRTNKKEYGKYVSGKVAEIKERMGVEEKKEKNGKK